MSSAGTGPTAPVPGELEAAEARFLTMQREQVPQSRFQRTGMSPTRDLGSTMLIGNSAGATTVLRLEGPTRLVWDILDTPTSLDEITSMIAELIPDGTSQHQISQVIDLLISQGAIAST